MSKKVNLIFVKRTINSFFKFRDQNVSKFLTGMNSNFESKFKD